MTRTNRKELRRKVLDTWYEKLSSRKYTQTRDHLRKTVIKNNKKCDNYCALGLLILSYHEITGDVVKDDYTCGLLPDRINIFLGCYGLLGACNNKEDLDSNVSSLNDIDKLSFPKIRKEVESNEGNYFKNI